MEIIERKMGENPQKLIIWLHGLGADASDFLSLVDTFSFYKTYPTIFVFPNAPIRKVTINQGMEMRAWYDITNIDIKSSANSEDIEESFLALEKILEKYIQKGITQKNIFLAGFSQGGVMACEVGLKSKYSISAVIGLSCYLANGWQSAYYSRKMNENVQTVSHKKTMPDFFLGHGTEDPIVPLILGKQARDSLLEMNIATTWKEYSGMPHSVCEQEIIDIEKFIVQSFSK